LSEKPRNFEIVASLSSVAAVYLAPINWLHDERDHRSRECHKCCNIVQFHPPIDKCLL